MDEKDCSNCINIITDSTNETCLSCCSKNDVWGNWESDKPDYENFIKGLDSTRLKEFLKIINGITKR